MSNKLKAADIDSMSDEDFMKLSDEQLMSVEPEPEEEEVIDDVTQPTEPDDNVDPDPENTDEPEGGNTDEGGEVTDEGEPVTPEVQPEQELSGGTEEPESKGDDKKPEDNQEEPEKKEDPKSEPAKTKQAPAGDFKLPEGVTAEKVSAALSYYDIITAPFKADGKDIAVRSAEDAVRLMQQGANYSRRMQEMKPMKAMVRMLTDHGLNDQNKLNFLIDLDKGDKTAITKLLKDKGIDPMDLDTTGEIGYQGNNYAGDPKDIEFREALDNVVATPEGSALVTDIQKNWDVKSKAALREDPSILGNLTQMQSDGSYAKVVAELDYQRSIGYLTDVPFLQAFDTVGKAMKEAGVFDKPKTDPAHVAPMGTVPAQVQPIESGPRKAQAPKTDPNPHLSSTPVGSPKADPVKDEPNFADMSDEEFMKLRPPV